MSLNIYSSEQKQEQRNIVLGDVGLAHSAIRIFEGQTLEF